MAHLCRRPPDRLYGTDEEGLVASREPNGHKALGRRARLPEGVQVVQEREGKLYLIYLAWYVLN